MTQEITKTNSSTHSWINFKIDKRLHTKFSMILKFGDQRIREVMTSLVQKYVEDNHNRIMEIISSPTSSTKEEMH